MKGFRKELKILKKIKHLQLKDNAGFPLVLSAKQSRSLGEIMMTFVGNNIFIEFNLASSFEDKLYHQRIELNKLATIGIQIISQLEVLHKLGYVHGDLKFQNLTYNREKNLYSIIDFALVHKIYTSAGNHKEQKQLKSFYGNSLFASQSMMKLLSISRKDDLESLMYILCFLYNGTIPVVDYVNKRLDVTDSKCILDRIQSFRTKNEQMIFDQIREMLPRGFRTSFSYILQLSHKQSPDYNFIKLLFSQSKHEEKMVMKTRLKLDSLSLPGN